MDSGETAQSPRLARRVWSYFRPYLGWLIVLFIAILGRALIGLVPPLLFRELIDNVLIEGDRRMLNLIAVAMVAVPVISGALSLADRYLIAYIGTGVIYRLRTELFTHLQSLSLDFFTHTKLGEILSRITFDVVNAQSFITRVFPNVLANGLSVISTLVLMLAINWRLALISLIVLPLFFIPARWFAAVARRLTKESMEWNGKMSSHINETLGIAGVLLTKTLNRETRNEEVFAGYAEEIRRTRLKSSVYMRGLLICLSLATALGTALTYWLGGQMVIDGDISLGTIVAFSAYLVAVYSPLAELANLQVDYANATLSFERVFRFKDLKAQVQDAPDAVELDGFRDRLSFEHIHFRYKKDDDAAHTLHDVHFEIPKGSLVALVGPSGSGKTTLAYLLARLHDPDEGAVRLDGHDLRQVKRTSLVNLLGLVSQESFLFNGTVRDNLLYAKPEATEAQLREACRKAHILTVIDNLPDGMETRVGERGYRLSGGEKQRIALARVILKDPEILILDEATSNLDSESERLIQDAMETVFAERTALVIAHRLSTVRKADTIVVLDRGKLVEQGTHEELLAANGVYASLYHKQFSREGESRS
ncbi:MAG: ABC transporter ATP-binding protein [Acidobacteriota bacterium]|nr:ABC transporter ATP-binding protein [Acidobacteriota bacterium]